MCCDCTYNLFLFNKEKQIHEHHVAEKGLGRRYIRDKTREMTSTVETNEPTYKHTPLCPPEVHYLQQEVPCRHFLLVPGTMAIVAVRTTLIRRDLTSEFQWTINPPPLNGTSDDRLTRWRRQKQKKTTTGLKMVKCVRLRQEMRTGWIGWSGWLFSHSILWCFF